MEKLEFKITDTGVLMRYQGSSENIVVPEGVKVIGKLAFNKVRAGVRWCRMIKSITLPQSLESIEKKSFLECTNLERVHLRKILLLFV